MTPSWNQKRELQILSFIPQALEYDNELYGIIQVLLAAVDRFWGYLSKTCTLPHPFPKSLFEFKVIPAEECHSIVTSWH